MNLFGGFGRFGRGENCCCTLIWLLFLLSICGCGDNHMMGCGDNNCMDLIFLLLLLSCCGCGNNNPCGNN